MKLRNKKTGEIYEPRYFQDMLRDYGSIKALTAEWEDYEEPKVAYFINAQGDVIDFSNEYYDDWTQEERIGNKFETKEEAEKAVEKLKAWKRLKDKGFDINYWAASDNYEIRLFGHYSRAGIKDDLDFLFGGEE